VKRFLWGVDGVNEVGNEVLDELLGGVCERVGSLIVVECDEGSNVVSGERFGGVGCGISEPKISPLRSVENVRFASSAEDSVSFVISLRRCVKTYFFENEARHVEFASSFLTVWRGNLHHAIN
jgi:hypothetical protein